MADSDEGDTDARTPLRWRQAEDPLIVEAAEVDRQGWRHLTVTGAGHREYSPALARLFAEFPGTGAARTRSAAVSTAAAGWW